MVPRRVLSGSLSEYNFPEEYTDHLSFRALSGMEEDEGPRLSRPGRGACNITERFRSVGDNLMGK